jgi:hypothetical protein
MNIAVIWDNDEKTIIRYIYEKNWTWADVNTALKDASALLDTVDHKVDIIMDFRQSTMMIPMGALSHAKRALSNPRHDNIHLTVLVGDAFVLKMADVSLKLSQKLAGNWELKFASTLDEAYAYLAQAHNSQ